MDNGQTINSRLVIFRKQQGYTQKELAKIMGISWTLISDYERGKLRLHDKVIIKFAKALKVSADQILGIEKIKINNKPSLKIMRRLKLIEELPQNEQKALLRTIDGFLKGSNLDTHKSRQ
jgi:transcriptional regulator with XRE-family HTH domain